MKFEVKNNQTNETEFYVKWSKPSQFKYQHFSTLNDTGKNNNGWDLSHFAKFGIFVGIL